MVEFDKNRVRSYQGVRVGEKKAELGQKRSKIEAL